MNDDARESRIIIVDDGRYKASSSDGVVADSLKFTGIERGTF
jgi:hypothetical protein